VNPLSFEGRSVVITGAGGGLGRSYAQYLSARGALVTINDIKVDDDGLPAAEVAAQAIVAAGGKAVAHTDSVADEAGAFALVETARSAFGRVDAVINNAGSSIRGRFGEQDTEILEHHLAVHVKASFNVTRAAWALMQAAGHGRVVFTTSAAGIYGVESYSCYGTAKTALIGLARCLAQEGREHGIMTNVVMPRAHTEHSLGTLAGVKGAIAPADEPTPSPMPAELVAPVVGLLVHEQCPASGSIFATGGGRVAEIFLAETRGYVNHDLTIEDLAASMSIVRDRSRAEVPANVAHNLEFTRRELQRGLATTP
jgi:NAD(P)-dependent dehydrogenase (short-subunit alcohol dehydrogenase family)